MKKDHHLEIVGYTEVVRMALRDLEGLGRTVPKEALAALAAVEQWLAGKEISPAELQAATDLSFQEGVPFAKREKDRALSWARTAAGNLCWLAKKDRGWEKSGTTVMDAAVYALSSLSVPGVKEREEFEKIRLAAMAAAGPAVRPSARKPAKTLSTNLTAFVGAAVNKRLAKLKPAFDPAQRGSEAELRALLKQRKYPEHACVLEFDKRYGGLIVADAPGEEGDDWLFGAYACLKSKAHTDPRGEDAAWVPVAYAPNDYIFYLDAAGVAWQVDTIDSTPAEKFAPNAEKMLARIWGA